MKDQRSNFWAEQITTELTNAEKALAEKNDGKARACARRAAGIIIKEYLRQDSKSPSQSALDRLKNVSTNEQFPEHIRKAALRLITNVKDRLSPNFTFHPIHDAEILITYFKDLL